MHSALRSVRLHLWRGREGGCHGEVSDPGHTHGTYRLSGTMAWLVLSLSESDGCN